MPNMISSKLHSISEDIESGDCPHVRRDGFSSDSVMNGKRQSVNWETCSHSGNKAAITWLILLFLSLGFTVQQASLSTVVTRATMGRSTLENSSFNSPEFAGSKSVKRQMLEVEEETDKKSMPINATESSDETIEQEPNESATN
uniref:Uncharacterized protein n=1 Tax=Pseudo-nitzschia delicatissima TaxID=44447 RepID=A0A7S0UEN5_9STRA|mmetsp:Transcript_1234/g.2505  ORF Transcript_1234/g.2505 Transcript_1234/m.2505 type:complete len:144 (+) Transcript_1234:110-541(+)